MKGTNKDTERLMQSLMKKSVTSPASDDFDDKLMEKIAFFAYAGDQVADTKTIRKAWIFWSLAVVCLLVSSVLLNWYGGFFTQQFDLKFRITLDYVLYGGLALFVPLLLYFFDSLISTMSLAKRPKTQLV